MRNKERKDIMKKFLCLLITIALMIPFAACMPQSEKPGVTTPAETTPDSPDSGATPVDPDLEIKVTVLSGTTGMGMAKLIS